LAQLFNSSKIYLYDSAEYWVVKGLTEGLGLPPLEALACGCIVFSSVNHINKFYSN
jgi:glycosyltransferase involved in cell wall biosynthesis